MNALRVSLLVVLFGAIATMAGADATNLPNSPSGMAEGQRISRTPVGSVGPIIGSSTSRDQPTANRRHFIEAINRPSVSAVARELRINSRYRPIDGWLMFLILVGLMAYQLRRKQRSISQLLAG